MVDTPLSLVPRDETDCFRIRRCVFQEDAVLRMLSVFRSTSTEDSIRVGALRQLATMLDDPGLHDAFLNDGGLESICEKFLDLVRNDVTVLTGDVKPSLASCIMIIKLLVRRDSVVRERMSRDLHIMTALLKAADLCRLSIASLNEISVVIALLVFHDVIKVYVRVKEDVKVPDAGKNEVTELSLPAATLTRYQVGEKMMSCLDIAQYRFLAHGNFSFRSYRLLSMFFTPLLDSLPVSKSPHREHPPHTRLSSISILRSDLLCSSFFSSSRVELGNVRWGCGCSVQ